MKTGRIAAAFLTAGMVMTAVACLVRTQVYATQGNVNEAIRNLEKYIELTGNTSLYETVAQLNETKSDTENQNRDLQASLIAAE